MPPMTKCTYAETFCKTVTITNPSKPSSSFTCLYFHYDVSPRKCKATDKICWQTVGGLNSVLQLQLDFWILLPVSLQASIWQLGKSITGTWVLLSDFAFLQWETCVNVWPWMEGSLKSSFVGFDDKSLIFLKTFVIITKTFVSINNNVIIIIIYLYSTLQNKVTKILTIRI